MSTPGIWSRLFRVILIVLAIVEEVQRHYHIALLCLWLVLVLWIIADAFDFRDR